MPMHNLLECNSKYLDMTGSLWFCFKDEARKIVMLLNLSSMRLNY